jgi:hypothetical protein
VERDNVHTSDEGGIRALKQSSIGPVVILVLATGVVVATVLGYPDRSNLALHAYLVLIGFLVLWTVAGAVSKAYPSGGRTAIELALQRRRFAPETLREIQQIELEISVSSVSGLNSHSRLWLLLRRLAAHRLAAHHNVDLGADPATAKTLVGDQLWAAITEDARSADHDAAGVQIEELEQIVSALESM